VLYFMEHLEHGLPLDSRASVRALFCDVELIPLSHRSASGYSAGDDWIRISAAGAAPSFFSPAGPNSLKAPISLLELSHT